MRRVGLIGGTGFGSALAAGAEDKIATKYGETAVMRSDLGDDLELIFLARHGAGHKIAPHLINHRANIAALAQLDICAIFATAAVGSLQTKIEPGDFVLLDDFVDMTRGEPVTFFDRPGEVRHSDMSEPYNARLRQVLLQTAGEQESAAVHATGTYLCVSGPRYETPAEIALYASWGASVVGMTSAPEAVLCREMGLPYASIAVVTNYGCGLLDGDPLSHASVETLMAQRRNQLASWILRAALAAPSAIANTS